MDHLESQVLGQADKAVGQVEVVVEAEVGVEVVAIDLVEDQVVGRVVDLAEGQVVVEVKDLVRRHKEKDKVRVLGHYKVEEIRYQDRNFHHRCFYHL